MARRKNKEISLLESIERKNKKLTNELMRKAKRGEIIRIM